MTVDPSWVSEPNGRGTWGLLQSCLITLGLCVYTALHLNIPPIATGDGHPKPRYWGRVDWRRVRWVAMAALAPEFVLVMAYRQWSCARELRKQINNLEVGSLQPYFRGTIC